MIDGIDQRPETHRLDLAIRAVCATRAVPDLSDLEVVVSREVALKLREESPGVIRLARPRAPTENRRASAVWSGSVALDNRFRRRSLRLVVNEAPGAKPLELQPKGTLEARLQAEHAAVKSVVRDVASGKPRVPVSELGAIPLSALTAEDLAEAEALANAAPTSKARR